MPKKPMANTLYYGDNLDILRDYIADESVDLVYLDPPFNSNATYNVLFKSPAGEGSQAQIEAFEDTWHWNHHAEDAFDQVIKSGNSDVVEMLARQNSNPHSQPLPARGRGEESRLRGIIWPRRPKLRSSFVNHSCLYSPLPAQAGYGDKRPS
jgi:hypothetical protein